MSGLTWELQDVLSVRFDTVYDAFVYFDLSGDWQVTTSR